MHDKGIRLRWRIIGMVSRLLLASISRGTSVDSLRRVTRWSGVAVFWERNRCQQELINRAGDDPSDGEPEQAVICVVCGYGIGRAFLA